MEWQRVHKKSHINETMGWGPQEGYRQEGTVRVENSDLEPLYSTPGSALCSNSVEPLLVPLDVGLGRGYLGIPQALERTTHSGAILGQATTRELLFSLSFGNNNRLMGRQQISSPPTTILVLLLVPACSMDCEAHAGSTSYLTIRLQSQHWDPQLYAPIFHSLYSLSVATHQCPISAVLFPRCHITHCHFIIIALSVLLSHDCFFQAFLVFSSAFPWALQHREFHISLTLGLVSVI